MYIVSSFDHSIYFELAITDIEEIGIARQNIIAVPLNKADERRQLFDTIHRSDGISLLDTAAILGTAFSVLGTIFGFAWKWGPVIWGLIGLSLGAILGFLVDILIGKEHKKKKHNHNTEIVLIINCTEHQSEMVETILRRRNAIGVGTLN